MTADQTSEKGEPKAGYPKILVFLSTWWIQLLVAVFAGPNRRVFCRLSNIAERRQRFDYDRLCSAPEPFGSCTCFGRVVASWTHPSIRE